MKAGGRVLEGETRAQRDARARRSCRRALGQRIGDAVAAAEAVLVTFFDVAQTMPVLGKALKALRAVLPHVEGHEAARRGCRRAAAAVPADRRDARPAGARRARDTPAEALEALGAALAEQALAARYAQEDGAVRVARGAPGRPGLQAGGAGGVQRAEHVHVQAAGEDGGAHPGAREPARRGLAAQPAVRAQPRLRGRAEPGRGRARARLRGRRGRGDRRCCRRAAAAAAAGGGGNRGAARAGRAGQDAGGAGARVPTPGGGARGPRGVGRRGRGAHQDSFAEAGERVLGLPPPDKNASVDERCAAVRDGLMRLADRMFLVVLDNVDDARLPQAAARRAVPRAGHDAAARRAPQRPRAGLGAARRRRDVLLKGVEGGGAALSDAERGAARRMLDLLGMLTLALDVASRLLECEPPSRLLRRLEAEGAVGVMEGAEDEGADDQVFDKPTSLRVLFGASTAQLDGTKPADALALEVAGALAFLAPTPPVPLGLLRRCVGGGGDGGGDGAEAGAGAAEALLRRALHRLSTLGLVRLEPGTREPSAHRLVLAYWRHRGGGRRRRCCGASRQRWGR